MNIDAQAIADIEKIYAKFDATADVATKHIVQKPLSNKEIGLMDDIEFLLRSPSASGLAYVALSETIQKLSLITLELEEECNAKTD